MKITRKDFLRLAGFGLLAGGAAELVPAILPVESVAASGGRKRWGMAVDFQKCEWDKGCDGCVVACRTAHNVPQITDKTREVKWLWKEQYGQAFPAAENSYVHAPEAGHALPILCNHCASPACTKVCPTGATWKREADGVVMMDWHRCIGCRYCMAACPYGSRSFNWSDPRPNIAHVNPDFPTRTKGVVEKCNFCEERLAEGKQPACADACTKKALLFGDLEDANSELRRVLAKRFALQRRPELGTGPAVYYLV